MFKKIQKAFYNTMWRIVGFCLSSFVDYFKHWKTDTKTLEKYTFGAIFYFKHPLCFIVAPRQGVSILL